MIFPEVLNNLPTPDYDDTGFFPRPKIEKDLKKKILGRHPVVTVLGDGGNGKTAVTLQTLYSLLAGNDHNFDAIIWVSAKSSKLTVSEIERIEGAITNSLDAFGEVVRFFEDEEKSPMDRVRSLLEDNKILLVIDNLETILDKTIREFADDVPGESKLVLTSRIPLGSDLTVRVETFTPSEAVAFLRKLSSSYNISELKGNDDATLKQYAARLDHKPLLLKWFALGVLSGLNPATIVRNPEIALRFVLENVFEKLSENARNVLRVLAALPKPASLPILEHIIVEGPNDIEAALSELMQFTIVEQDTSRAYEIEYRVKPIAKSYLVRVLRDKVKDLDSILSKYRAIDAIYQGERADGRLDRYNPRNYIVRSRSEALATRKIRIAVREALNANYEEALQIIEELKRSHPDYFEVLRAEAFVCIKIGDLPRAQMAYDMAIELDPDQPQIHHYYGGFLLRTFSDLDGALEKFMQSAKLDPDALHPIVEAARVQMFLHNFDEAQNLISQAFEMGAPNLRSKIILFDLQLQNYGRRFDRALTSGNPRECIKHIPDFTDFLNSINVEHLDPTLLEHLQKYSGIPAKLQNALGKDFAGQTKELEDALINALARGNIRHSPHDLQKTTNSSSVYSKKRFGALKQQGLKPTFGFIQDGQGCETFVARTSVSPSEWKKMVDGVPVEFEIDTTDPDRTRAINIKLKPIE